MRTLWCCLSVLLVACSSNDESGGSGQGDPTTGAAGSTSGTGTSPGGPTPPAGNPAGKCTVPTEASLEDVKSPTSVVGTGTPASCTAAAFETAVHGAGVITFNCGPDPVTITLDRDVKVINDAGPNKLGDMVIDGGGKVTLSGGGKHRILYQNGCDAAQHYISSRCDTFDHPRMTVQNLVFADGYANDAEKGGGALFVQSGRLKILNSTFVRNTSAYDAVTVGGGAVAAYQQAGPVYVVNSTFGGAAGQGNSAASGGAVVSIGVSWTIVNSAFSFNRSFGVGQDPPRAGTKGGGNGGALTADGNTFTLDICGTDMTNNTASELAGAVFMTSNDRSGTLVLSHSTFRENSGINVDEQGFVGFFVQAKDRSRVDTIIE